MNKRENLFSFFNIKSSKSYNLMGGFMLTRILQFIGITCLLVFSFFYTDRVVTVVKNQDPIMMKINNFSSNYNVKPVNVIINGNEIIPGISGCCVDINKSYSNMKKLGEYAVNKMEYIEIKPELTISNIYDKYIIKGNKKTNEVALVFKLSSDKYINHILGTLRRKQAKAAFFLDGTVIENSDLVYAIIKDGHELYNLGYNGNYNEELFIWTNNLIETISNNKSKYCLVLNENKEVLNLCSKHKMYTIKSDLVINYSKDLNSIRDKINKGSIIVFDISINNTLSDLNNTITFLNKKGYKFNLLSEHLSEKGC